jgi:hypothetical protein
MLQRYCILHHATHLYERIQRCECGGGRGDSASIFSFVFALKHSADSLFTLGEGNK